MLISNIEINRIKKKDLLDYFHLTNIKKKDILNEIKNLSIDEKDFYYHFKYELGVTSSWAAWYLKMSKCDIDIAMMLHLIPSYLNQENKCMLINLYDLKQITNDKKIELRSKVDEYIIFYRHKTRKMAGIKAAIKAKETLRYRKENMPEFLKNIKLKEIQPISKNIKRLVAIAKLSNSDIAQDDVIFQFGKLKLFGKVYAQGYLKFFADMKEKFGVEYSIYKTLCFNTFKLNLDNVNVKKIEKQIKERLNKLYLGRKEHTETPMMKKFRERMQYLIEGDKE